MLHGGPNYIHRFVLFVSVANNAQPDSCNMNSYTKLQDPFGYISAQMVTERAHGSRDCPWRIQALPGQSVSVTLISLGAVTKQHTCKPLGYVNFE